MSTGSCSHRAKRFPWCDSLERWTVRRVDNIHDLQVITYGSNYRGDDIKRLADKNHFTDFQFDRIGPWILCWGVSSLSVVTKCGEDYKY